jgi:hypothetical protein
MIPHPKVGEYVSDSCPRCNRRVRARLELRSVEMARSRLVVPDVLVDVCPDCGHMITVVPQGVEQLREAGRQK